MPNRREREEALIADAAEHYERDEPGNDLRQLAKALEAAHRREDAIRACLEHGPSGKCISSNSRRKMLDILDGDNERMSARPLP